MYKKSGSAILIFVIGAALIFGIVKSQTANSEDVQAYAAPAETQTQPASPTTAAPTAPAQSTETAAPAPAAAKETAGGNETAAKPKPSANTAVKPLKQIFNERGVDPARAVISITVDKSDHTLGILADGKLMKSYHVELGEGGPGDKKISGDHKTPEGTFYITERSVLSPADYYLGSRWMELSYPNIEDADRGLAAGIISQKTHDGIVSAINKGLMPPQDTALGGGVGIHGGSTASFGSDWTWGCVGLTNRNVEDFYGYMKVGTKVVISK